MGFDRSSFICSTSGLLFGFWPKRLHVGFQDRRDLPEAITGISIPNVLEHPEFTDRRIELFSEGAKGEAVKMELGIKKIPVDFSQYFGFIHF